MVENMNVYQVINWIFFIIYFLNFNDSVEDQFLDYTYLNNMLISYQYNIDINKAIQQN